jgi:hypothetical protein
MRGEIIRELLQRLPRITVPVLLVPLTLTACGPSTLAVPAGGTLRLTVTEYQVRPQSVSAQAGPLTIVVRDTGRLVHNLAILNNGHVAAATPPIRPGSSATLTLALGPGTYVMASTLFFDESVGTYGTLRVTR